MSACAKSYITARPRSAQGNPHILGELRECAKSLPDRWRQLETTQRKPICVVALSCDCGDRAAGRYRWQYSGAHRCEPPLITWLTCGSGAVGPQHDSTGPPTRWWPLKRVVVHSHTLPIMSTSPYPFGGNEPTGEVPGHPSAPSLRYGNLPCQVLAISWPSGFSSSPHEYVPVAPARAAYSHSASVGRRRPAHRAYAAASGYATCTTG